MLLYNLLKDVTRNSKTSLSVKLTMGISSVLFLLDHRFDLGCTMYTFSIPHMPSDNQSSNYKCSHYNRWREKAALNQVSLCQCGERLSVSHTIIWICLIWHRCHLVLLISGGVFFFSFCNEPNSCLFFMFFRNNTVRNVEHMYSTSCL